MQYEYRIRKVVYLSGSVRFFPEVKDENSDSWDRLFGANAQSGLITIEGALACIENHKRNVADTTVAETKFISVP